MQIGAIVLKIWAIECSGLAWFRDWKTALL